MRVGLFRTSGFAVALLLSMPAAAADPPVEKSASVWVDPATAPAEMQALASRALLLDIVRSGSHYVTAGARGDILLSDDASQWRQVEAPTRATLTALAAVDAQVWAVGHDGVIVHSGDGGEHWQIQRSDPWKPGDAGADPIKGAPLLDVLFTDAKTGFAIGAYCLALRTSDGGEHWNAMTVAAPAKEDALENDVADDGKRPSDNQTFTAEELKVGQESTPHLNAITRTGSGALFIVAERGSAFSSRDNGASWKRLQLPYDGSMFGVLGYEGDHVLAFGLRGHVYESTDLGAHWTVVATGTELSLMGGAALADGGAVIVGANGIVLARVNGTEALRRNVDPAAGIIAAALPLNGGPTLLLAGENGISRLEPK